MSKEREFKSICAGNIHSSSIIPPRSHDYEIAESVKTVGVQQPLIVRRSASNPDEYELIDGKGRHDPLKPEEEVYVDVREASDVEVFRISDATSKRTQRSACENAFFYYAFVKAVSNETGEKGALSKVAKHASISESELSQYLAVKRMFDKLGELDPEQEFRKLQCMGLNKLYELSMLADRPELLGVAQQIEEKADHITVEGITEAVNNVLKPSEQPDGILKELLGEADNTSTSLPQADKGSFEATQFKAMSVKVSAMIKELNTILPKFEIENLIQTGSEPSNTLSILEKICVSTRRLLYYLKKIKEPQDAKG